MQLKKEYFSLIISFIENIHDEVASKEDKARIIEAIYEVADPEILS